VELTDVETRTQLLLRPPAKHENLQLTDLVMAFIFAKYALSVAFCRVPAERKMRPV
jgi:hypothetical protein